jgi:hypothetical protein
LEGSWGRGGGGGAGERGAEGDLFPIISLPAHEEVLIAPSSAACGGGGVTLAGCGGSMPCHMPMCTGGGHSVEDMNSILCSVLSENRQLKALHDGITSQIKGITGIP